MNAPFNTLTVFRTVAALRDAVLAARPPDPKFLKISSPGKQAEHELLVLTVEAMRDGRMFVFDDFVLDEDAFHALSNASTTAFADRVIDLPYPMLCGVAGLVIIGEPRLTMVMTEEVDTPVSVDGRDLGKGWAVHVVVPVRRAGGIVFNPFSRRSALLAEGRARDRQTQ